MPTAASTLAHAPSTVGRADLSQYTFGDEGRSACTAIALVAARALLPLADRVAEDAFAADAGAIGELVMAGVASHGARRSAGGAGGDHEDAASVLHQQGTAAGVRSLAVRQGMLQQQPSPLAGGGTARAACEDLSLEGILRQAQAAAVGAGVVAVVLTKPPETVLAIVPAGTVESVGGIGARRRHAVFDSHPRPGLDMHGAHLLFFDSLLAQAQWLEQRDVFPRVDLGAGADDMQSMVYNMFDATLLALPAAPPPPLSPASAASEMPAAVSAEVTEPAAVALLPVPAVAQVPPLAASMARREAEADSFPLVPAVPEGAAASAAALAPARIEVAAMTAEARSLLATAAATTAAPPPAAADTVTATSGVPDAMMGQTVWEVDTSAPTAAVGGEGLAVAQAAPAPAAMPEAGAVQLDFSALLGAAVAPQGLNQPSPQ